MRELLVSELTKEVLGPRNGSNETLDYTRSTDYTSPLNEYISGVLAPQMPDIRRDIEGESEMMRGESQVYEDEAGEPDIQTPPLLSPALDPKSRPTSMGMSFLLHATKAPEFDVCITWAKYEAIATRNWQRRPRLCIQTLRLEKDGDFWFDSRAQQTEQHDAEASFHVRIRPRQKNLYFVTLYFVNRIMFSPRNPDDLPSTEQHIFQPQMRVKCHDGTRVIPQQAKMLDSQQDNELNFLYRYRRVLGRGHLCSVVWAEIDPERPYDGNLQIPSARFSPPFTWTDGVLLPETERTRFTAPDIRTEFIPIYNIPSADHNWPTQYGRSPQLSADVLAEAWESNELRNMLKPLSEGYSRWIDELSHEMTTLSDQERTVAARAVQLCQDTLRRIDSGIELLATDEDARLAFCFANKALDIQHRWDPKNSRREGLVWRPFQLAFVLLTLESITNPQSAERDVCDLMWIPTGAGKTEAYFAIAAYTIAHRRRRAHRRTDGDRTGAGVSVITRYTLRLLTIQQFRRALATVTACEYLRTEGPSATHGWRPRNCSVDDDCIWGTVPFGLGLWVGIGVTPNKLLDGYDGNRPIHGALSILAGHRGEGEPAQILNCPACDTILSVSQRGLHVGRHLIHLVVRTASSGRLSSSDVDRLQGTYNAISLRSANIMPHRRANYYTLTLEIETDRILSASDVDSLWKALIQSPVLAGVELVPARASRPGYFIMWYTTARGHREQYDFSVYCPNPRCPLIKPWCGGAPSGLTQERNPATPGMNPLLCDGNTPIDMPEPFLGDTPQISDRTPIPVFTVDEQLYRRLPSMIVATVDKFARLPFEARASGFFGNVDHHHCMAGYYRVNGPAWKQTQIRNGHPIPGPSIQVCRLDPPDIVLQDELHLIEGPLGSLVGIYETGVAFLGQESTGRPLKYIASTATVRRAEEHVQSIFARRLQTFPPAGLTADNRFFVRESELHPLSSMNPGRLYMGICAPGRGPLTPLRNIWARLLQTAWENRSQPNVDTFWTLTGYFNARRELAGARPLYRQDIRQRLEFISGGNPRQISDDSCQELSSRTEPTALPSVLDLLETRYPHAQDALFTTSMFGTGVDIPRIGLMVVHGQPKTTSTYIQSTGRVGRTSGALVVTFLRASRPRDLNHYEFFCGYHRQLHKYVEPLTAYPFAPGVVERAGGPVTVLLLRHMRNTSAPWHLNDSAPLMGSQRVRAGEVDVAVSALHSRATNQPGPRTAAAMNIRQSLESGLDLWRNIALLPENASLVFYEYAMSASPEHPVVLGDSRHQYSTLSVVYRNTPQSLRDVEETAAFET
jgi:hypothetical protein